MKKDVDDFGNKENIKPPSCIVLIHASENSTDLDVLYYPVQLIGIEPPNRTIFITRYAKKIGRHLIDIHLMVSNLFSFLRRSICTKAILPISRGNFSSNKETASIILK